MQKIRFTLFLILLSFTAFGQLQYNLRDAWSFGADGVLEDDTYALVMDNDGFVFVAGYFSGSGDFDPDPTGTHVMTAVGGRDIFIAKYDVEGDFQWAWQFGANGDDKATAITLDNGNPVIVGTFVGDVDFNPDPDPSEEEILSTGGGSHAFMLKLQGSNGDLIFAKNFGGAPGTVAEPFSIVRTVSGFHVAGRFLGSNVEFATGVGSELLTSEGDFDIFVASYDDEADIAWAVAFGGTGHDVAYDLIHSLSRIYITGSFTGTAGFGSTELNGSGGYLARLNTSDGSVDWAVSFGGSGTVGHGLSVDEGDKIFVGGEFSGSHDFDPDGSNDVILAAAGTRDGFLCRFEDDGEMEEAVRLGGFGDDYILDVATDVDGNVYSAGPFSAPADFHPGNSSGDEYLLTVGGGFISMLDNDLGFLGAKAIGDNGGIPRAIVVFDELIASAGSFTGTVDFDMGSDIVSLTSQGSQDGFVQILELFVPEIEITQQPVDVYTCQGSTSATFTTAATGTTNITYRWYHYDADFNAVTINDGAIYSGVATPTLTISVSTETPEGYYFCEIFGDGANDESTDLVLLTINPPVPSAPDVTRCGPGPVTLLASGGDDGDFRWYTQAVGGTPIAGEVNYNYVTPSLTVSTTYYVAVNQSGCEGDRAPINANISTCQPAPGLDWVKQIGGQGSQGSDAIARDGNGNLFVAGNFNNTITDFDPGAGVETLPYVGGTDMYVVKFDPNGDFLWARAIAGNNNETPISLKIDASGNLYLYFEFRGTLDADPGASTVPLQSTGVSPFPNQDVGIVKLDNDGLFQWARQIGSAVNEYGGRLELDASGNPYLIGVFQADITVSTTSGPALLDNQGGTDVFITRMNPIGDFIWAKSFGGTVTGGLNSIQDQGNDIAISSTHVFATGNVHTSTPASIDFDPGAGTASRPIFDDTAYILKLTTDGDFADVYLFDGGALENSSNGLQVETDASGNIYAAGNFNGTVDFDPSGGVFEGTHISSFAAGVYLTKLAANGSFLWAKFWNPSSQGFTFADMKLSTSGDIYSLVNVGGIVDADPGPLVYQVSPNSLSILSVSVLKLSNDGDFNWITQAFRPLNITSGTLSGGLFIEASGDVYVAGQFSGTVDFDPHACQSNLASVNNSDGFFYKLSNTAQNICITEDPLNINSCTATTATFYGFAAGAPGINYQWQKLNAVTSVYEDLVNGGAYSGVTTEELTVTVADVTTDETYRVVASAAGAEDQNSAQANLFLVAPPAAPTTTGASGCAPGSYTISAAGGAAGEYFWYHEISGESSPIFGEENDTYTTPVLSATKTYYVSLYDGVCETERIPVTVTIGSSLSPPTVTGASTCLTSASLSLTAAGSVDGNYRWYAVASGGTPIPGETNGTFVTPVLSATTSYYTSINDGTCESTRVEVTAVIDAGGSPPSATDGTHCGPGPVTLSASGAADGLYRWYTQPSGGSPIAGQVNSTYTTPEISTETTYHVSIAVTGCESARTAVDAMILLAPTAPAASNATICGFGAISVAASGGTGGHYRWYTQPTGGTALVGEYNSSYITPDLSVTTILYVSIVDGSCESARTSAPVQVIPFPNAPTVTNASGCPAVGVMLSASGGNNGEYRWYTVASGGSPITGTNNSNFATGPLAASATYYVSVNTGVCEGPRMAVVATIVDCGNNQPPAISEASATSDVQGTTTLALLPLLTDPDNNLDLTTLRIIQQPTSGALATIDASGTLTVDYAGVVFVGDDSVTIEICDLAGSCAQRVIVISVAGNITVYNAISPNGDGKNDTFHIQFIGIIEGTESNKVTIFNRWGDVVFEMENYNNVDRVFTGKADNGNDLPSGTYFYKIAFIGGSESITGYLSLKK
jgi:gliding motility-associated-like protein